MLAMIELIMPGCQSSCFTSHIALTFAFALHYSLCPGPCSALLDTPEPEIEYDFIVVGAGSAGAVVANRLSECHNWTVLLLEAGGLPPDFTAIPLMWPRLLDTEWDWKYKTESPKDGQAYCLAGVDRRCPYSRGKVVGGTSVLNSLIYARGNRRDYDDWESMGNEGWGYDNVLKYFLKSENNSNPAFLRTPFHSSGGYLSVEDVRYYTTPFVTAVIKAGEYLGYKYRDSNGEDQEGLMIPQFTTRKGTRWSTSKAFIQPAQDRPNFDLSMHSYATEIGFETGHSGPIARTVTYTKENRRYTVRAKKEIIVSGGTINSAQLLLLSGIGPEEHLKDLGIKVWKNLPVGYNFQDHIGAIPLTFKVDSNITFKPHLVENPDTLKEYFVNGRGPLTTTGSGVHAFLTSKYANHSRPDLYYQFLILSPFTGGLNSLISLHNLRPNVFDGSEYQKLDKNGNYFSVYHYILRPKSRGRLTLRSKNPYDHPIIDPNFFAMREDVEVLVNGLQTALKLVDTPPFKKLGATPLKIPFPSCERLKLYSDEYFECYIRHYTSLGGHQSSTCAMGTGPKAVVDPRLRVIGIKGLRVIDASIMPFTVSGNTNAPIIMIAEKGSDLIKEDWEYLDKCPQRHIKCKENNRCSRQSTEQPFGCKED